MATTDNTLQVNELLALIVDAAARTWVEYTAAWAAHNGVAEIDIAVPAGEYWACAVAWDAQDDVGATDIQVHVSTLTGFTPGSSRGEFYTSDAAIVLGNGVYAGFSTPVPITVIGGNVHVRQIPDAGTTDGNISFFLTPNQ
tara:strand:- start:23 stop:445 length:423 start_codon:yes stop_codon:yes gene_type:complete